MFGDASLSMVLRATQVNPNLTITDAPEPCNPPIGIEKINNPFGFELLQNYPNPFSSSTVIEYRLQKTSKVLLTVTDLFGRTYIKMVDDKMPAGIYQTLFEPKNLESGVYYYTLDIDGSKITKKMIIAK